MYTPLRNSLRGLHGVYNLIEVISSWTEQKLRSILKWICYCCLTPSGQFSINILAKPSYISMRRWWHRICTRQTLTIGFYSASSLKQQTVVCSTRTHCPYSESRMLVPLTPYCWMLCEEKANTILESLVWPDRYSNTQSYTFETGTLIYYTTPVLKIK